MIQPLSGYVPIVAFRSDAEQRLLRSYIESVVQGFFQVRGVAKPIEVPAQLAITDLDFGRHSDLPFHYFYEVVMNGVRKRDGKIMHVAYTLTCDPDLAPDYCERSDIHYGTITLGGKPVLYFLRLDLPTLIRKLRHHDFKPGYKSI